jgi:RNA polymerase sigma-70 factor (ECF subfamily)
VRVSPTSEARFRAAFDAYFEHMNRYCLRRIPSAEVNDTVADVFTVAWRKVDQMPEGAEALPWLYGVARNEIRNRQRSRRRSLALMARIGGQARAAEPGPESEVLRNIELRELMAAVETLRPADREVLLLRTHEELDYAQIAVAMSMSPEAARKRLARAVARLRRAARIPDPASAGSSSRAITEGGDG